MAAAHLRQVSSAGLPLGRWRLAPDPTMATAILPTDMATATRILGTAITRPPTPIQGTATATIRPPTPIQGTATATTRPPTPIRAIIGPLTTAPRMAWVTGTPTGLRASGATNTRASPCTARRLHERQAEHRLPALPHAALTVRARGGAASAPLNTLNFATMLLLLWP